MLYNNGTAYVDYSPGAIGTLNLRETVSYNSLTCTVTRIADGAFFNNKQITGNLVIPNTVTHIGNSAFRDCTGLNGTLTLPDGLLTIGSTAFYQCESLTGQLILPATLTSIGESAFDHCRGFDGSTLTLPPLLTEIEPNTFYGIHFTGDLVIPDGITTIGEYAFVVNRFSSINIGDGVTTIGNYAFSGSIASQLTLGRNVTSVGEKAFQCGEDGYPVIYIECKSTIPATLGANVFRNYGITWEGITVPCGAKDNYLDPVYGWTSNSQLHHRGRGASLSSQRGRTGHGGEEHHCLHPQQQEWLAFGQFARHREFCAHGGQRLPRQRIRPVFL
ncbi:MAG: leucine-rich repeat domain-containing protein [Bacteroidales bacterium]|nr:leucine-rich repeat domain-containing protein [Bacteroidales bacterium]